MDTWIAWCVTISLTAKQTAQGQKGGSCDNEYCVHCCQSCALTCWAHIAYLQVQGPDRMWDA